MLKCNYCDQYYPCVFYHPSNNAWGCSSHVIINASLAVIYADFGSKFDGDRFIITHMGASLKNNDILCDDCLDKLLEKEYIFVDTAYDWHNNYIDYKNERK